MKVIACTQGSEEWHAARRGKPTASRFDAILTPKTLKPSASSRAYLAELLAEEMLGVVLDPGLNAWMERGHTLEEQAVSWYEFTRDVVTEEVGFVTTDDGRIGCSPDRLVGEDGGLEVKCLSAVNHVRALLSMPSDHLLQCHGGIYVTGRAWWDLLYYNPEMPPVVYRVERDEEVLMALGAALASFLSDLGGARALLLNKGVIQREPVTL